MSEIDYEAWALEMCALLDRIEAVADDEDAVRKLCRGRFALAKKHNLTVTFLGPTSGTDH